MRRIRSGVQVLAILFLGTAAPALCLELAAWKAYESVEEAWLRERHGMLVEQAPAAVSAAELDLEIRLAELQRRGMQFRHIVKCEPGLLAGGVWQLSVFTLPVSELDHIAATIPEYRKQSERIRQLTGALERHPQYEQLKRAQGRLWKTPPYRDAHRRYTGRLQELQATWAAPSAPSVSIAN